MVRALNPPIGATIYYYLKADAQKVTVTIKNIEGTTVNEFTPTAKKGLQKAFWNLNRQAPPGAAPVGRRPRRAWRRRMRRTRSVRRGGTKPG